MVGLALLFIGFALIAAGSFSGGDLSTGGFILIGPLPIVFGSGKDAGLLAALSVIAGLVMLVTVYVTHRRSRTGGRKEQDYETTHK